MLLAEKTELLYTVQPENPKVQILDTKIEVTREGLLDYIKNLLINNSINLNEIDNQLAFTEKDLDKLPETERMLISLERKYKVNDQIYTYLLQKRAESAIAKAANVSDNKILDFAIVDNAVLISPKKQSNIIIGLIFGIVFPLTLLVFLDFINNKITTRTEIESKTSVPIISTIGHNNTTIDIPVFAIPKSSLAESFRGLRTNLQYMLRDKDQKVITITSTISGEGKTFCSSNLAAIFAMAGKKTLLVGLDLRKPKIHKAFNLNNSVGVSTYLIGKTEFREIVQESKIENLFIATSGPIPPNPAELLGSPVMKAFLDEARENFEIIILDTPPFGMVTDSFLISQLSDLTLFIIRQNYSTLNILNLLEEIYQKGEIGQIGLIMNDINKKGYYGYGYRYYNYSSGYRYGYYNYANYHDENG
jgi:capsular exopolysaccharide synthesis family protein